MATTPAKQERALAAPVGNLFADVVRRSSVRYWICVAFLLSAALGLSAAKNWFGWYFRKEPVELLSPLLNFDTTRLGPRYVRDPLTDAIPAMSEDMIQSLGTREFTQFFVTDTTQPPSSRTRMANVFITYYTGESKVPHVPDECYLAGGYDLLRRDTVRVPVRGVGAPQDEVPVRVLEFAVARRDGLSMDKDTRAVMYFFHANGRYATTRDQVRLSSANLGQRYAYYAKIEIFFSDGRGGGSRDESIAAVQPLLERLLPVLLEDHLDLSKFDSAADH